MFDLAYFQIIGLMKEELLAAVPLFVFMGFITEQAGLMERLFRGVPPAARADSRLALPGRHPDLDRIRDGDRHRRRRGHRARHHGRADHGQGRLRRKLSAGTITAGGTLGILIPPSVMLVVMGPVLGVSVADLYAAAFGPGFLLAGMYIAYLMTPRLPQSQARAAGPDRGAHPHASGRCCSRC